MAPAVLIADADPELCDLYRRFFSHPGRQVRMSGGGLECLARLRQFPPQLLILDRLLLWGGAEGVLVVMRDDPGLVLLRGEGARILHEAGRASGRPGRSGRPGAGQ